VTLIQASHGAARLCVHTRRIDFFTTTETDCVQVVDAQGTLGTRVRVTLKDANGVTTTLAN
jgi:hypothetical protein